MLDFGYCEGSRVGSNINGLDVFPEVLDLFNEGKRDISDTGCLYLSATRFS